MQPGRSQAGSLMVLGKRADWQSRYLISSSAAAAAARDGTAEVALFFDALVRWVQDDWDGFSEADPFARQAASAGAPPLSELLADGRREGRIKVYACTASVRWGALAIPAVERRVDAILGWSSFVERMEQAATVLCV